MDDWDGYILVGYDFSNFAPGARVLDVGCGNGFHLERLSEHGIIGFGLDIFPEAVQDCKRAGHEVCVGAAEALPVRTGVLDGIVCKVVVPYTDEARALAEISRVLKFGGLAELCYHGIGYYLRYVLLSPSWKYRLYGLRTLLNTLVYGLTGKRLPGFLGDTLAQSRSRLSRYYRANSVRLVCDTPSKTFLGFPVFIYHRTERVPD